MGTFVSVDKDAFSSGQITSKIWLCEELENLFDSIDNISIYGGWYGVTAFLLRSRNNIKISKIYSYDLDPHCEQIADTVNENWVIQKWQFKSFTTDCNELVPNDADLIINTSTEHFQSMNWFKNIPKGKIVALQGNNMPHEDHFYCSHTIQDFISQFEVTSILYHGEKDFVYPDWSFKRFMLIGIK